MILITTQTFPPDIGGIETLMAGLAKALARAGEQVRVFADGRATDNAVYEVTRFAGLKPLRRIAKARAVANAARQPGVSGVFAESWKSVGRLPALCVPIVVLAHGAEWPLEPSPDKRRRIVRAAAKAHRIIAVSEYTAARVRAYAPDLADRITVIHPPIEPQPAPSATALAAAQALRRGGGPLVATLARLEPRKGVDVTLRALADLAPSHPDIVYAVAGGGDDLPRLRALSQELSLAERVRFLGRVDEDAKAALLAAADVFVMPTRQAAESVEGFGIIYLEAAWHGTPAIAGLEGGGAEAVRDGVTGLVVDGEDPGAVAAALRRLIDHPDERAAMGRAAAARVRAESLWEQAAERFLAVLSPI
jgi:phosphatidylinositol alpha-1,6-mannosyltransferase